MPSMRIETDFDHRPATHDVVLDVGTDPPDRIGDQSRSTLRIKLSDGHHEADIAFLN